jgi:hypothetical protein
MSEKTLPLHSEFVPSADLVGMVSARVLNRRPDLSGLSWMIEIALVPGGVRLDVYPAPQG